MPHIAVNYNNTKIYIIRCKNKVVKDFYIGHSVDFTNRKSVHKNHSKNPKTNQKKIYKIINENGGWDNWEMIELEKYPCSDANEARKREKYWEDKLNPTLNTNSCCFIPYDNSNVMDIVGKDKKDTQKLRINYRQKIQLEELVFLQKENKKLKELLKVYTDKEDFINHLLSF